MHYPRIYVIKKMDIISSDNVGKYFRYVNNKLGSTKTVYSTKIGTTNNNLTDYPAEQANIFNDYFRSVFTVDNKITPQVQSRADNTTFCDFVFFMQTMFVKHYYLLNPAPLLVLMEYPMYFLRSLLTLFVILYVAFLF